jgi:NAD(P)-dependent dehydrogenase (short-subunit alcohol dehydrogenase family)
LGGRLRHSKDKDFDRYNPAIVSPNEARYHLPCDAKEGTLMRVRINQQVALVTGGAHRVGKAIAVELARQGAHIVVHYNTSGEDSVRATVQEIKSLGVDALSVQADLSQPEGVEALFAAVRQRFGKLHILINSASIFQKRGLLEITLEEWRQTMDINLTAPFLCTQQAAALIRETLNHEPDEETTISRAESGCIVNIGDRGSLSPWVEYAHHGISKAGLLMLTKVSAASLGPDIRVNMVIPGAVLKPPDYSEEQWLKSGLKTPLRRTGAAEDVARAVAYLVTESFVTGAVLEVDGGAALA